MRDGFGYSETGEKGRLYDLNLLKRLFPYTKNYRRLLTGSVLLVVLITILDLTLPLVTRFAIDTYILPVPVSSDIETVRGAVPPKRYYSVDLSAEDRARVVATNNRLFRIEGNRAWIPYTELHTLDPEELSVLRQTDVTGVAMAALVLLAILIAGFCLNFLQVMIMEKVGQNIMHRLRMALFIHIQGLPISFYDQNPVGRLVTRVSNDIQNMHEFFTSVIAVVFKDIFLLVGIGIVLTGIHLQLALISFTVLPLVLFTSFRFASHVRDIYRKIRGLVAEINTQFSETISGIRVIQLFQKESLNHQRFQRLNHENYLTEMKQIHVYAIFMPVIEIFGSVAVAVILYFGGKGVLSDTISLGDLVAFISYIRMFFRPIRDLAEKYNILQNSLSSAERIFGLLDQQGGSPATFSQKELPPAFRKPISTITFRNVRFGYFPEEPVLQDISFSLEKGQSLAVVGPTGSGKTTIINLLTRFYSPDTGTIRINGVDTSTITPTAVRARIAVVTQDPFLFSDTLRSNIFPDDTTPLDESAVNRVLQSSCCQEIIDKLPLGLDTVLAEGGGSLSSGERQLVSIARAVARNPELIILDEATSFVDSGTEKRLQAAIGNLLSHRTSIVIAHRLSTIQQADGILVLQDGSISEYGTHTELLKKRAAYFRLYNAMAG